MVENTASDKGDALIVAVPAMHEELVSGTILPGVRFFDPGLEQEPAGGLRPEELPLDPRMAKAVLADMIRFGEQFKKPSDMAAYALEEMTSPVSSLRAEMAELSALAGKGPAKAEPEASAEKPAPDLSKAQLLLLMAWSQEVRHLELLGLDTSLEASWEKFGKSLGVEDDEDEPLPVSVSAPKAADAGPAMDWRLVAESLAVYLDETAVLFGTSPDACEFWRSVADFGPLDIETVKCLGTVPDVDLSLFETAKIPAWGLAGKTRSVPEKPWLDKEFRIICPVID